MIGLAGILAVLLLPPLTIRVGGSYSPIIRNSPKLLEDRQPLIQELHVALKRAASGCRFPGR